MYRLISVFMLAWVVGCSSPDEGSADAGATADVETPSEEVSAAATSPEGSLAAVLAAQPEEVRARYEYRHPAETLTFFGIEPGMTVVEGLPGSGWYTKILVDYLGPDGRLIGANYALDMYPLFSWVSDDYLAEMEAWSETFPADATEWGGEDGAAVGAFHFGAMPESMEGTADAVLLVRALHNPARFQNAGEGPYLDDLLADARAALEPGGVLGVVQHHARDGMPDEFADGSHGYLKKDWLIEQIEKAGFEFVAESDVNANPKDQPSPDDVVWRLPPNYSGSRDDPEKRAAVDAIGETNRMTLKFVKPE